MARHPGTITQFLLLLAPIALVSACGGDSKKSTAKPVAKKSAKAEPKKETEADREAARLAAAQEIIPDGSACLPLALKEPSAPTLELGAIGKDAVVCAIDTDEGRLLGPVGCWTINLETGALAYKAPAPIPGHGFAVQLEKGCARGYCLPKGAGAEGIAHMVWNTDGSKVAVLVGEDVHLFAAEDKAHESSFSIRGDKGVVGEPTALHWAGGTLFVQGKGEGAAAGVWAFKTDGTAIGALEPIGSKDGKPLSTQGGSFSILDKTRVGVAENGYSTMTIYDADTGARSKLVRKLTKPPCKAAELQKWWLGEDGVGAKCKTHMEKNFGYLIGATAVAGSKSFLVLLRGPRLGELGVLDIKTLAEKKAIKMPWCAAGGAAEADAGGGADDADAASDE